MTLPDRRREHARAASAHNTPTRTRVFARFVAIGCLALALAGCTAEPGPVASTPARTPAASQVPSAQPTQPAASPAPSKTAVALPADCQGIYSPGMLQSLNAKNPPLNDPGVTMTATEVVEGLELLSSGAPTMRCSWGVPSDYGLATNVTIVTPAEAAGVITAMRDRGFTCIESANQTRCERTEKFNDPGGAVGEAHVFRDNIWVATRWLNFAPEGYTDDIIAQLFA